MEECLDLKYECLGHDCRQSKKEECLSNDCRHFHTGKQNGEMFKSRTILLKWRKISLTVWKVTAMTNYRRLCHCYRSGPHSPSPP
jgi:hypothetical protein